MEEKNIDLLHENKMNPDSTTSTELEEDVNNSFLKEPAHAQQLTHSGPEDSKDLNNENCSVKSKSPCINKSGTSANSDDDEFLSADEGSESDSDDFIPQDFDKPSSQDEAVPGFHSNKDKRNEQYEDGTEDVANSLIDEEEKKNAVEKEALERRMKEEEALSDEQLEERRSKSQELKDEGNNKFRSGAYDEAIDSYTEALSICPLTYAKDRSILYSNRAACKMKKELYGDAIADSSSAIDLHPQYIKALLRRAELYEKTEKLDEALKDYQQAVELDPSQHMARASCLKLAEQIKDRNEKMKDEMIGKLKELGNMVLRPFGLSTNNFAMEQDPSTGSYSVQFKQNPNNGS